MQKVIVPIYLKLVFFTLCIMAISLSAYVYYAVDLFKSDKLSYVFEAVDDYNQSAADKTKTTLNQVNFYLEQASTLEVNSDFVMELLKQNSAISAYFEANSGKLSKIITFKSKEEISNLYDYTEFESNNRLNFLSSSVVIQLKKGKSTFGFLLTKSLFFSKESELYQNFFIHNNVQVSNLDALNMDEVYNYVIAKSKMGQTFKYNLAGNNLIVSAREVSRSLYIMTTTKYSKAVAASERLRENSIYFGLLIAGILVIVILFFSQFFTRPLNSLTTTVNEFLTSNFKSRAKIKTSDEIGFLAISFNKMADDIDNYMLEMEEKLRLEEELKTANLVQSQFFPKTNYKNGPCHIEGRYQSATECGGDWWGVYEGQDYTVVIIADVTGHGTPAALMTAVLHSAINSLRFLSQKDPSFLSDSDKIMSFLNASFCHSTDKLNATAFVLCVTNSSNEANYSNASHNPPYYFARHNHNGEVTKSDIVPLMDKIDPRLGEFSESHFHKTHLQLHTTDKIFFYTDGIVESVDINGKAYGQRKFLNSLLTKQSDPIDKLVDNVNTEFKDYIKSVPIADDYTFVGLEVL